MLRSTPLKRTTPMRRGRKPMRRGRKAEVPREIREHWARVRALGCIVTGTTQQVTIHHIHSGSVADMGLNRGSTRSQHYLVIPLALHLHSLDGNGIDANKGVRSWELQFGTQVEHMDEVCRRLGINVWRLANVDRDVPGIGC